MDQGVKHLETIGALSLYLDWDSRDFLLAFQTDVGLLAANLTAERACQLGIALVRQSGRRFIAGEEGIDHAISNVDAGISLGADNSDGDLDDLCVSPGAREGFAPQRNAVARLRDYRAAIVGGSDSGGASNGRSNGRGG